MEETNLKMIAKIERFLDDIEGLDSSATLYPNTTDFKISSPKRMVQNKMMMCESEKCTYSGGVDEFGEPDGPGTISFPSNGSFQGLFDHGVDRRQGIRYLPGHVSKITGTWINGKQEGYCQTEQQTGDWFEGTYHQGARLGNFRSFAAGNFLKEYAAYNEDIRYGWVYEGKLGGGYMIGQVVDGELTGNDIFYVYPDFRTALRGKFEKGVMISAKLCKVISSQEIDGRYVPILSEPTEDISYSFDPATSVRISSQPLLQDPWEQTLVEVKPSLMDQAGDGLFAKQDLPEKTVIALFAGIRLKNERKNANAESNYKIMLNADECLDIPQESIHTKDYCATLAHKANHSFSPNGEWSTFEHPRFGLIRAISSKRDIQKGEEILINYNMEMFISPEWYRILWVRHLRETKRWTLDEVARFVERNYELSMKRIPLPATDILQVPEPQGVQTTAEEEFDTKEGERAENN